MSVFHCKHCDSWIDYGTMHAECPGLLARAEKAEARVAELEAELLGMRLPKVWVIDIAGREIVLRYENGHMSACATLNGDDEPESFVLKRDGIHRIDGWPPHPDDEPIRAPTAHKSEQEG